MDLKMKDFEKIDVCDKCGKRAELKSENYSYYFCQECGYQFGDCVDGIEEFNINEFASGDYDYWFKENENEN